MQRSIVKHCTPRSQIMWNVTLNSSYTSSYIINVDQNKKRKQSPCMRRRDCNLPLNSLIHYRPGNNEKNHVRHHVKMRPLDDLKSARFFGHFYFRISFNFNSK